MTIAASRLQHGDVLLYEHRKHVNFFRLGIRLITGSRFTHCGVIQQDMSNPNNFFVLEQLTERTHSWLPFYYAEDGEVIHVVRPVFTPPILNSEHFQRKPYGYLSIIDCLINHFLGRITFGKWIYKVILAKKSTNIVCSSVVGKVLDLPNNVSWCTDIKLLEPDDYFNHWKDFQYLGEIDWTK